MEVGEEGRSWRGLLDSSGRLLIPAESRKEMGWSQGTDVVIESDGDSLRILTLDQFTCEDQHLCGRSNADDPLWSEELIAERRDEARREAADDA